MMMGQSWLYQMTSRCLNDQSDSTGYQNQWLPTAWDIFEVQLILHNANFVHNKTAKTHRLSTSRAKSTTAFERPLIFFG